jgi:hypothetical protein
MLMIKRTHLLWLPALFLIGCGDTTTPRVPTTLQLDRSSVTMAFGDTVVVHWTVLDQHGASFTTPPSGFNVNWSSSSNAVVTVDAGRLIATGPGHATVTASAAGVTPIQLPVTVQALILRGQRAFSLSGDSNGTFSIDETFNPFDPAFAFGSWVLTMYDSEYDSQDVIAQRRRADGRYDLFAFWVDGRVTSAGTRSIERGDGVFIRGIDPTTADWESVYDAISGQATFATVGGGRMTGTFSLEMTEEETGGSLQVTSGTFDVPILSEDVLGAREVGNAQVARAELLRTRHRSQLTGAPR